MKKNGFTPLEKATNEVGGYHLIKSTVVKSHHRRIPLEIVKSLTGFTFVEALVSIAIFLVVAIGLYSVLSVGRSTWFDTDTSIGLQQNLRFTLEKITRELHESGFDKNAVWQVTITDGGGVNGTDLLRFSMPIICHGGDSVIDSNGDIAHWGVPLTWGCTSSNCMDADNDCATTDYKSVEYSLDNTNQLMRTVFNNTNQIVRQDVVARDITNFQISNSVDKKVVTLQVTAQKKSVTNRTLAAQVSVDVKLRN